MNCRRPFAKRILIHAASWGMIIVLSGCRSPKTPLENLNASDLSWATYTSDELNYSIEYPTVLSPSGSEDGEVLFRYGWGVPVRVRFNDEAEGRKTGAWFGSEPVEKIKLGGHDGEKFIYKHYDGPFGARTVSYVVEYRRKFLGLEFRTDGELNEIQKRMLASFVFSGN